MKYFYYFTILFFKLQLYKPTLSGILYDFFQYNESMKRNFLILSLSGCIVATVACASACQTSIDYFHYVSENRNNVLVAEGEDYHLKIYAVDKEYPYSTDGYTGEVTARTEVYFSTKGGGQTCELSFTYDGKKLGGEMSYDNVDGEYSFSCAADLSAAREVRLTVRFENRETEIIAVSVKGEHMLSSRQILSALSDKSHDTFSALTQSNEFQGEIYIRLIYESAPYYYVGVIGRDAKTTAFLMDAVTGEILATKQN